MPAGSNTCARSIEKDNVPMNTIQQEIDERTDLTGNIKNHVKNLGADACVAKLNQREFASTIRDVLPDAGTHKG